MTTAGRIAIAGAGSIGCYVGGMLAAAGRDVAMLARPRVIAEIQQHGLRLSAVGGHERVVPAQRLAFSEHPDVMNSAAVVLVAVKSADTADIADLIAHHAPSDAVVVSLQNGVGNTAVLRERLPGRQILGGVVPFNVIAPGDGRYHRATSGEIVIQNDPANTAVQLSLSELPMSGVADIVPVQWGKLLVNLNNALNALAGVPLRTQLANRRWRQLFADQMAEGLTVLKAERIAPVSATSVPARLTPHLLRLPDFIFSAVLAPTMKIDPTARSSMWDDLQRGRRTEVDYLQGVIVDLASRHGIDVPLSRRVVALIRRAEEAGQGSPGLTPEQVRSA